MFNNNVFFRAIIPTNLKLAEYLNTLEIGRLVDSTAPASQVGWMVGWLDDWSVGWMIGLACWLFDWSVDWIISLLIGSFVCNLVS